jgi:hypothetical protein
MVASLACQGSDSALLLNQQLQTGYGIIPLMRSRFDIGCRLVERSGTDCDVGFAPDAAAGDHARFLKDRQVLAYPLAG